MNYWKDIPLGQNPPEIINAVIEGVSGSRDKYEYKSEWEAFTLDRVIPSSVVFPIEYGFVPQTWYDDQDPLDIMVMSYEPLEVGCIVRVRVIGVLEIEDEKGVDSKILSVLVDDARFEGVQDITDVHVHQLREIQEFFETYKRLEPHKWVKVKGWEPAKKGREIVQYASEQYQKHKK
ncbi:MAG: inorganic diphosphatase [Candidatus Bathyarchaeota archaeon]|nr:inorganic diphosphatase [Candidatus Bathyarchaeum tardum]WGM89202.1 MAG: inorganic diphosphatase [Candidatus Bathyarchaeum tardum]WNZ28559.1 MAG: inorganic diphosphatase [Candidatus Bathyarchaeota archaeon]